MRRLDARDVDSIFELSRKNELFDKYHPPFVTKESILDDMRALPPGKGYEDKFYVGFFEQQTLVALMDLILAYPEPQTAFIVLFMMNADYPKARHRLPDHPGRLRVSEAARLSEGPPWRG